MIQSLIDNLYSNKLLIREAFDKAKVIAIKNSDDAFVKWLDLELFGYRSKKDLPFYRIVKCKTNMKSSTLFGINLKKASFTDLETYTEAEKLVFDNANIIIGISAIETLYNSSKGEKIILPEKFQDLSDFPEDIEDLPQFRLVKFSITREIERDELKSIIERVKHKLLEILSQYKEVVNPETSMQEKNEAKQTISQILNNNIHITIDNKKRTKMGDTYNTETGFGVGPNATVNIENFQQNNTKFPDNFDYEKLSEQLTLLKAEVVKEAIASNNNEQLKIATEIGEAQNASIKKDSNKILSHLAKGGEWLLKIAEKLSVDLAASVIAKSLGS